jgi:hypothetical protein
MQKLWWVVRLIHAWHDPAHRRHAQYRLNTRSTALYLKQNTFDPVRGQDIPRQLGAQVTDDGNIASSIDPQSTPSKLVTQLARAAKESNHPSAVVVDLQSKETWNKRY